MTDLNIKVEFAARERKYLRALFVFALPLVIVVAVNSLSGVYVNPAFPFLVLVSGFIFATYKWYRCPKCDSIPRALGRPGVQLFPKECVECGAKLR